MRPLPCITIACAALLLTGCGPRINVRPALPICPEPIVLPRSMTAPLLLPAWFPLPKPIGPQSLLPPPAPPKCTRTPKP